MRFQLLAGSRVALRTLAPVAAGAVAASVMYGTPMVVIRLAQGLFFSDRVSIGSAVFATVICLAVALSAVPRLTPGLNGWARHLPASGVAFRRAATAGLAVVQLPVLALVMAGGLAAISDEPSTTWPRLAALVPLAWATSLGALKVEHSWTRAVAVLAALGMWIGSWMGLVVGVVLLVLADAAAGSLAPHSGRSSTGRRIKSPGRIPTTEGPRAAAVRLWWRVSRRALGWRMIGVSLSGLLALAPVVFFLRNNELTQSQYSIALRLATAMGVVFVMATAADGLVKRRPPWPWIRSLPWSASTRVSLDGALLVGLASPVLVVAASIDPGVVWVVAGAIPLIGLRGAAAIRQAPGRLSAASGQLMVEGVVIAILVALLPWASFVFLALTPVAVRHAAELERRREISRWHELHHLAAGDPMSWSDA